MPTAGSPRRSGQGSRSTAGAGVERRERVLVGGGRAVGGEGDELPVVTAGGALSHRLTAEVRHEGTRWVQEYERGVAVTPPTAAGPATGSGTVITFHPDPDIFEPVACSFAALAERFQELAFLNRGLCISLTDERTPGESQSVRFCSTDGPRDFVAFLDSRAMPDASSDL